MEQKTYTPKRINKEQVADMKFPIKEVLKCASEIRNRGLELHKAMVLGNSNKVKFKITFEDFEGMKQIETTIWGVTSAYVCLKANALIPVYRIHCIEPF